VAAIFGSKRQQPSSHARPGVDRRLVLGVPGSLIIGAAAGTAVASRHPAAAAPAGRAALDWRNVVSQYGADPTGAKDSTGAIQNAVSAAISAGGGVVYLPAGTYRTSATITANVANTTVRILGDANWATRIDYHGAGDCLRMYDSSSYRSRTSHGSGISGLTIDGSNAGAGAASAGLHAGDILQFGCDISVQNVTGSGSIGVHLDNTYCWTEQLQGRIYAKTCSTNVMFDNSANASGQATGSFERLVLDIFVENNGAATASPSPTAPHLGPPARHLRQLHRLGHAAGGPAAHRAQQQRLLGNAQGRAHDRRGNG
jgi:hypothetical protein